MKCLGAWGTLIHEKNLKSKISCQTPFKAMESFIRKKNLRGDAVYQMDGKLRQVYKFKKF